MESNEIIKEMKTKGTVARTHNSELSALVCGKRDSTQRNIVNIEVFLSAVIHFAASYFILQ